MIIEQPTIVATRNDISEEDHISQGITLWILEKREDLIEFYFAQGFWTANAYIGKFEIPLNCYGGLGIVPGEMMVIEMNIIKSLEYSQGQTQAALILQREAINEIKELEKQLKEKES